MLADGRLLVHQGEDASRGGKGRLDARTQTGHRDHRRERDDERAQRAQRHARIRHAAEFDLPPHEQCEDGDAYQRDDVGGQRVGAGHAPGFASRRGRRIGVGLETRLGVAARVQRNEFASSIQRFQKIRMQPALALALLKRGLPDRLGEYHRQRDAHQRIRDDGGQSQPWIDDGEHHTVDDGADRRNGDGGERVGVEQFKQLDVFGEHGDQIAAASLLELGRGKPAHLVEHRGANVAKQTERELVVVELLTIGARPGQQTAGNGSRDHRPIGRAPEPADHADNAGQHREHRQQIAEGAADNGFDLNADQRFDLSEHAGDHCATSESSGVAATKLSPRSSLVSSPDVASVRSRRSCSCHSAANRPSPLISV